MFDCSFFLNLYFSNKKKKKTQADQLSNFLWSFQVTQSSLADKVNYRCTNCFSKFFSDYSSMALEKLRLIEV